MKTYGRQCAVMPGLNFLVLDGYTLKYVLKSREKEGKVLSEAKSP